MAASSKPRRRCRRCWRWRSKHGAEIRFGEAGARDRAAGRQGVRIVTDGATIEAGSAIVAAGPWTASLLPGAALPLRVTRQVMGWFAPTAAGVFAPGRFPVFLIESAHGIHYGFPPFGSAASRSRNITIAMKRSIRTSYDRRVSAEDEALIRAARRRPSAGRERPAASTPGPASTPSRLTAISSSTGCPAPPRSWSPRPVPVTASSSRR